MMKRASDILHSASTDAPSLSSVAWIRQKFTSLMHRDKYESLSSSSASSNNTDEPSEIIDTTETPDSLLKNTGDEFDGLTDQLQASHDASSQASFDSEKLTRDQRNALVYHISKSFSEIINEYNPQPLDENPYKNPCYFSITVPTISLYTYIRRMAKYWPKYMTDTHVANTLIVMVIYVDRFIKLNGDIHMNNAHRIILTSFHFASIMLDDGWNGANVKSIAAMANIGGISVRELKNLEINFLSDMNYDLHVTKEQFDHYKNKYKNAIESQAQDILSSSSCSVGLRRG